MEKSNLIWLATIVNTHGLKGEVKILTNSSEIDKYFKPDNIIYLSDDQTLTTKNYRIHKNFLLVIFKEIDTFEQAELLKGKKIYIEREKLANDEFYFIDAINALVVDQKTKREIGIVKSFFDQKIYYSFSIETSDKAIINIPIIDEFITKFDKKRKILFVNLPEEFKK